MMHGDVDVSQCGKHEHRPNNPHDVTIFARPHFPDVGVDCTVRKYHDLGVVPVLPPNVYGYPNGKQFQFVNAGASPIVCPP